jgi:hypothetical protein
MTSLARPISRIIVLCSLFLISSPSFGAGGLSLFGGYLNSRLENKSDSQSFSLSSESGSRAGFELTAGYGVFEAYLIGNMKQQSYAPPVTKSIAEPRVTLNEYGAGLRYKLSSANFFVGYIQSDHVFLSEIDAVNFQTKKISIPLILAGAQVSAWTQAYTISLRITGGTQASAVTLPDSELKTAYEYFGSGDALIEYGRFWKIGAQAGAEVRKYKVESNTATQEFFAGIFFRIGGARNGFANEKYSPIFGN